MIDYSNCTIEKVSVHHVGNKTNGEDLRLSAGLLDIAHDKVKELLHHFFLDPFAQPEFNNFTFSNEDFRLNPVYSFAEKIFADKKTFHTHSVNLAKHLYELSLHPQIKPGDLFVAYFKDIDMLNDKEPVDAIGIFKSENRQSFLKLERESEDFSIEYEDGINTDKLDKGCLIFNIDSEEGFKVCIIDKANKSLEAQYWKDSFLQLKPCSDDYHHTKEFMNLTKNFVTKQISDEFNISKADQIDLLNRTADYFKSHSSFDKKEFEEDVLYHENIIQSFQSYDSKYREENHLDPIESFDISAQAVKKQARVFKSVLKLDKNFHIYIHGNRDLIEQGVDDDGRKFYKIYFQNEIAG